MPTPAPRTRQRCRANLDAREACSGRRALLIWPATRPVHGAAIWSTSRRCRQVTATAPALHRRARRCADRQLSVHTLVVDDENLRALRRRELSRPFSGTELIADGQLLVRHLEDRGNGASGIGSRLSADVQLRRLLGGEHGVRALVARELVRAVGQLQRGASEPRNWIVLTCQLGADGRPLTGERRRA